MIYGLFFCAAASQDCRPIRDHDCRDAWRHASTQRPRRPPHFSFNASLGVTQVFATAYAISWRAVPRAAVSSMAGALAAHVSITAFAAEFSAYEARRDSRLRSRRRTAVYAGFVERSGFTSMHFHEFTGEAASRRRGAPGHYYRSGFYTQNSAPSGDLDY